MAINGMGGGAAQARMTPAQWAMKSKMNARQAADAAAGAQTWAGLQGADDSTKADFLAHSNQGQQVVNQGINSGTMSRNYVNALAAGGNPYGGSSLTPGGGYTGDNGVHTPTTGGISGPLTGTPATGPAPGGFTGAGGQGVQGGPVPHGDPAFAGAMTQRDYLGSQQYNNGGGNNQVIRDWFTNHTQGGVGNPNQWGAVPPPPVGGGMASAGNVSGSMETGFPGGTAWPGGSSTFDEGAGGSYSDGSDWGSGGLSQTGSPQYAAPAAMPTATNQMSAGEYHYQAPTSTTRVRTNPNQFRVN